MATERRNSVQRRPVPVAPPWGTRWLLGWGEPGPLGFGQGTEMAGAEVGVDDTEGLHGGVGRRRPDEAKPMLAQHPGQGPGLWSRARHVGDGPGRPAPPRFVAPEERSQGDPFLPQPQGGPGVLDGG